MGTYKDMQIIIQELTSQVKFLEEQVNELTDERNMYRSQSIMRQNQIELLNAQLEQAYD